MTAVANGLRPEVRAEVETGLTLLVMAGLVVGLILAIEDELLLNTRLEIQILK